MASKKLKGCGYSGIMFDSRLEARYAAFFDLAGWEWEYHPSEQHGWRPDFRVVFPCNHSECPGEHVLLVDVEPFGSLDEFAGRPGMDYPYGNVYADEDGDGLEEMTDKSIPADASAVFGIVPSVSQWEMCHGAGGGVECIDNWVGGMNELWERAALALPEGR